MALVVEDEWLLRADLASELEKSGWKVLEASTGEKALQQLQAGGPVHLLITDIRLAGNLSGWDVAEALRLVKPDLPIIYISGNAVDKSRKVGGSVFLGKPCAPAKILETSRKLLQMTAHSQPGSSPNSSASADGVEQKGDREVSSVPG